MLAETISQSCASEALNAITATSSPIIELRCSSVKAADPMKVVSALGKFCPKAHTTEDSDEDDLHVLQDFGLRDIPGVYTH